MSCGLLGAVYNAGMIRLLLWQDRARWLPGPVRIVFPFVCCGVLLLVWPEITGNMGLTTLQLEHLRLPALALALLLAGKIAFSCVSFASGVSGGILMPILLAGSMAGALLAAPLRDAGLVAPEQTATLLVLGMAGLFTDSWTGSLLWTQAWGLPVGSLSLGLDALSRVFLLPVFGLGFVCACAGGISLRHTRASEHNLAAHWLFYLLLVLGMAVVMMARDAVLFLLAWEVMSLSPFFLIDFNDSDRNVRDASWVYLVAAHLGAVLLLAFFGLLWQNSGDTAFATLALKEGPVVPLASVLFVLSLLGFGAKAGIAPMHVWLPEAHPAAPASSAAANSWPPSAPPRPGGAG